MLYGFQWTPRILCMSPDIYSEGQNDLPWSQCHAEINFLSDKTYMMHKTRCIISLQLHISQIRGFEYVKLPARGLLSDGSEIRGSDCLLCMRICKPESEYLDLVKILVFANCCLDDCHDEALPGKPSALDKSAWPFTGGSKFLEVAALGLSTMCSASSLCIWRQRLMSCLDWWLYKAGSQKSL